MKKKLKENKLIIIFFLILFLVAIPNFSQINGNIDETLEQNIVLSNFSGYAQFFHNNEVLFSLTNIGITRITYSVEIDHGVACYYPLIPILLTRQLFPDLVSNIWHIYIFMIFFLGVIFFYKTIKLLFNNEKIAIIMTLLYYFSPRIFIDAMHNNKDIALMSLLIITIYYLIKIIKKEKNKDMIIFAIVAAFLSNIKIIGVFFTGILGLEYIIYLLINKKMNKEKVVDIIFVFVLYFLIFMFITPAMWSDGLNIVGYFKYCLLNSTQFSRWAGKILFEGKRYYIYKGSKDILPWYYIPKNISLTLPLIVLFMFVVSIISFLFITIKKIIKKKKLIQSDYHFTSIIIMLIIPLLVCIFSHPVLYNSWRHFYFLYGLILLISSYILNLLWNKKYKNILVILIIISLSCSIYDIKKYGVKNAAYYNILAGTDDISKRYELDYYNITSKDAIEKFINSNKKIVNKDKKIYLFPMGVPVMNFMYNQTISASFYLSDRVIIVDNDDLTDLIKEDKKVYLVSNPVYTFDDLSSYKLIYNYKYKNSSLVKFYLINKDNYKEILKKDSKYHEN